MVRGILWDNDGVLVDTERVFYEANRDFLAELGLTLTEDEFVAWYLCDQCGAWPVLRRRGISEADIHVYRKKRDELFSRRLGDFPSLLNPGMDRLLDRLHKRVRMGIVTSSNRQHFDIVHARLNIGQYFEFVLTAECYEHSKPSPDPYLLGLKHLGLDPEQCIVIEDSPRGLHAAQAAGIRCLVLRSELTKHCAFDGAFRIVDSIAELDDVLEALLSIG